jgi:hypothetical protein
MDNNYKIDFIEFLKREFGFKRVENCQPVSAVLNVGLPAEKKSATKKFKWLIPNQSKDLAKVLDIKIAEEKDIDSGEETGTDFDDTRVDDWQQEVKNFKNNLPIERKPAFSFKKIFVNIFAQPFSNVPGILSYCREEEPEEKQSPAGFKYLSLIIIVFIFSAYCVVLFPKETKELAHFNEKIFIESWYKNGNTANTQNVATAKINPSDLANFIRINADKLKLTPDNKQSFVLLSQDDILGRPAAAEESNNSITKENKDNWLVKIGNVEAEIIDGAANILYSLGEKQKNFSIYLGGSLGNVLGQ